VGGGELVRREFRGKKSCLSRKKKCRCDCSGGLRGYESGGRGKGAPILVVSKRIETSLHISNKSGGQVGLGRKMVAEQVGRNLVAIIRAEGRGGKDFY